MGDRTGLTRTDRTNGYEDGRGYMRAKKAKLAQQNEQIRDALRHRNNTMRTDLFKGISINVNGRTQPTADELKRVILLNGGEYHPYYRYQQTKFMIATNLSTARIKNLRPDDRIVKPEWITDSIKANCILPFQDYQLFADEPRGKTGAVQDDQDRKQKSITDYRKQAITNGNQPSIISSFQRPSTSNATAASNFVTIEIEDATTNSGSQISETRPTTTIAKPIQHHFKSNGKLQTNGAAVGKRPTTMDAFVVRGAKKPSQGTFNEPYVGERKLFVANICGQTDVDDVIRLLNEWVGCPEGITDEDLACVIKYFYDLMSEKDFHNKFFEVINALQQRVVQHGELVWIEMYNNLVGNIKYELRQNVEASKNLCQLITTIEVDPTESGQQKEHDGVDDEHEHEKDDDQHKSHILPGILGDFKPDELD